MSEPGLAEAQLRERLRKIEALFAGAATDGERAAAGAAQERVRARLAAMEVAQPAVEIRYSLPDPWMRTLFLALSRRYGLRPYRYPRQHRSTLMLRVPQRFQDEVLWPEYLELSRALRRYLDDITQKIIRDEVFGDTSDAPEQAKALGAAT